ncbi:MAG TPA: kelch repeat-containing protein [Kofleriaceae bacterium]|nr:kelch repeat-containing protein [Kofleriaceae bacterium]
MKRALPIIFVCACSSPVTKLAPIIDAPSGTSADPFVNLDELEVSVAIAGANDDLVAATFARGAQVSLPGVPYEPNLVVHMTGRASGAEVAYGRTCAFDLVEGQPLPEPHLYLSRTVKWAAVDAAPVASRVGGSGWPAADGSGLYVAGLDGPAGAPVTQIDRFDPRTATYESFGGVVARVEPAVAPLGDGRIVIVGGRDPSSGAPLGSLDVIDPLASPALRVTSIKDDRAARTGAAAVTQSDGRIALIGGRDGSGMLVTTVLEIRADAGAIALREVHADLTTRRERATVTRLGDAVGAPILVVGGIDDTGHTVATAELYKPLQEGYSPSKPTMIVARQRHAAVLAPDGSVLVVGGIDDTGAAVRTVELFSPDTGFAGVAQLPAAAGVVDFSLTSLPDGRFLLAGGRFSLGAPPLRAAFVLQLDPLDGTVDVAATDDLPSERAGHAAAPLCDGTILVAGGEGLGAAVDPARYDPPSPGRR